MDQRPVRRYSGVIRRPIPTAVTVPPERKKRTVLRLRSLPLLLLGGFAFMILVGALALTLPISSSDRTWTSPSVALFTSGSAVCVTGLVTVDTGTYWSGFGQAVILMLIQFGGLGFMTSATLLFLLFGWRVGLRERMFLSESLDTSHMGGIVSLVRRAAIFAVVLELIGFVILAARFSADEPLGRSLWWGLFHSVSAFNNAGFDVTGGFRSLQAHADAITLITVSSLLIIGGIGFLVVEDIVYRRRQKRALSIDTRLVLWTTAALLAAGFFVFLLLEWNTALEGRSAHEKLLQSGFHAATPRTAGFSSVPVEEMNDETQFFTMGLMFIGGASGSTAGGIKVGTFAIMMAAVLAAIRGRRHVEVAGREIRRTEIDRGLAIAFTGIVLIFTSAVILAALQPQHGFLSVLFETTSAFGTVGLSMGITPELNDASLLLITAMMYAGRLGPLTLVLALVERQQVERRRMAEERVRIG
jgi:trk system potassium uptake protein